jgi:hypothetical protein
MIMGITYGDYLVDSGYYDITPEQEREIEARRECARRAARIEELEAALERIASETTQWDWDTKDGPNALCQERRED